MDRLEDVAGGAGAQRIDIRWRREYDKDRYLQHASHAYLLQRLKDILLNLVGVGDRGMVGTLGGDANAALWWRTFTELLEEFQLRFGAYPAGFPDGFLRGAPLPDPRPPITQRAIAAVSHERVKPGTCLFKYGREEHLRASLEGGPFRISAASYYSDPSLNHAIKDDELSMETHAPVGEGAYVTVLQSKNVPAGTRIPMLENLSITARAANFYVWCFSRHLYPPLFRDFDADACLVIREPRRFVDDVFKAVATRLRGWVGFARRVQYVDPYRPPPKQNEINPVVCKHFRFWYQQEYRILWLPDRPDRWNSIEGDMAQPAPMWVELPDLRAYSNLIVI